MEPRMDADGHECTLIAGPREEASDRIPFPSACIRHGESSICGCSSVLSRPCVSAPLRYLFRNRPTRDSETQRRQDAKQGRARKAGQRGQPISHFRLCPYLSPNPVNHVNPVQRSSGTTREGNGDLDRIYRIYKMARHRQDSQACLRRRDEQDGRSTSSLFSRAGGFAPCTLPPGTLNPIPSFDPLSAFHVIQPNGAS